MAITSVRQAGLTGFTKYRSLADASGNPEMPFPGYVLLTPTSIAHSGTSASIGANGQVTFTAVTSLSLNGVFTAGFDNYVIAMRCASSADDSFYIRLRSAGTDNTTANSYVSQVIYAGGTSVGANRVTTNTSNIGYISNLHRNGLAISLYGPALIQPTALRSVNSISYANAYLSDYASTHNQSTSYDGCTLYPGSANMTGALQVYGVRS